MTPPLAATGSSQPQDQPAPPGPSLRPAAIVLGIVLVLLTGGLVAAALTGGPQPSATSSAAPGNAAHLLSPIEAEGQPPLDILDATPLPQGARVVGVVNSDQGAGQYDRTATCQAHGSAAQLIHFFDSELAGNGWTILTAGGPVLNHLGETEVLAKHASADGYYWEIGAVVDGHAPRSASSETTFSVRLYEMTTPD